MNFILHEWSNERFSYERELIQIIVLVLPQINGIIIEEKKPNF